MEENISPDKLGDKKSALKNKALEIADGWKNLAKSKLGLSSEEDEEIFKSRREICNACVNRSALDRCILCGCPLIAKTKSLISECPSGIWIK